MVVEVVAFGLGGLFVAEVLSVVFVGLDAAQREKLHLVSAWLKDVRKF